MTGPIVIAARARNRHGRAFEIVMAALSRTSWPGSCYRHGRDLAIVMVGIALFAMVGIALFAMAGISLFAMAARSQSSSPRSCDRHGRALAIVMAGLVPATRSATPPPVSAWLFASEPIRPTPKTNLASLFNVS
jgi:hypothetical protein